MGWRSQGLRSRAERMRLMMLWSFVAIAAFVITCSLHYVCNLLWGSGEEGVVFYRGYIGIEFPYSLLTTSKAMNCLERFS